ncbi:XRE family transcriptional regulator [Desulfosporosinus fructosivorans]|uniref:XRE family transcriptional regulator n=1 Tax=Desulfosporosinus fructosivorans TaxID=2018669 RepID=A0A4Z0QYI5_9FIRM|nr:helix-turn-helix transcriptional regulator [Desulfosporosinus fructosivorans]TGE35842.1 XRE family transcriptional regulator [Desulfosporosinus fructosivorans]
MWNNLPVVMNMNRVRKVRLQKGLTQHDLAELAGVQQKEISLIENDLKPDFTLKVAKRIANALGETVDYLWPDKWPD